MLVLDLLYDVILMLEAPGEVKVLTFLSSDWILVQILIVHGRKWWLETFKHLCELPQGGLSLKTNLFSKVSGSGNIQEFLIPSIA